MIANTVELASQFKAARHRLGLSQSQAAHAWKINLRTLQDWEIGRRFPRGETLNRLLPILFPNGPGSSTSTRKASE